ncbi:MAG: NAD-binding protein, partial [Gammaproteobacteria bacterium]
DPLRVREAQEAGDRVNYGDSARREILEAAGLHHARAVVVSYHAVPAALKVLAHIRRLRPDMPVLVRTRDDSDLERLLNAGATEVIPETLEASLMLASQLLLILGVPVTRVVRRVRDVRHGRYRFLRGVFYGEEHFSLDQPESQSERLHSVVLREGAYAIGRTLEQLGLDKHGVVVTAVRRSGIRGPEPEPHTQFREDDVLILHGSLRGLEAAEAILLRG